MSGIQRISTPHEQQLHPVEITRGEMIAEQGALDPLLNTIGLVILCVVGVFTLIAMLFACCNGCGEEEAVEVDPDHAMRRSKTLRNLHEHNVIANIAVGKANIVVKEETVEINAKKGVPQAAVDATVNLEINSKKRSAAPKPMEDVLKELQKKEAESRRKLEKTETTELLGIYNAVFQNPEGGVFDDEIVDGRNGIATYIKIATQKLDSHNRLPTDREYGLHTRMDSVTGRVYVVSNDKDFYVNMFAAVDLCLPFLIRALKDKNVIQQDKQTALLGLANAATHCRPRFYEETLKQLKALMKIPGISLEELFLRKAQQLKEDIILENHKQFTKPWYYEDQRFKEPAHLIKKARREIGKEWGLEQTVAGTDDIYECTVDHVSAGDFRDVLKKNYTAARFVEAMHLFTSAIPLTYPEHNDALNEYLGEHFPEEEDVMKFFQMVETSKKGKSIYVLTYPALVKVCREMGFLSEIPKWQFWARTKVKAQPQGSTQNA